MAAVALLATLLLDRRIGGTVAQGDDELVAAAIGPTLQRLVRIVALALAVGAVTVAGLADVLGVRDGVPSVARWLGSAGLAVLGARAAAIPLDDPATAVRNMRTVAYYPLLLALLGGGFHVSFGATPIVSMFLLFVAVFAALWVQQRWLLGVIVTVALGVQVIGTLRSPAPDWFTTAGFLVVASLAIVVSRAAGVGYRAAVAEQVVERQEARRRSNRLGIVADAARDLHVLDPDVLLASIADVAGRLGWREVGIWTAPGGAAGAGDGHATPRPAASLLEAVGHRGGTTTASAETAALATWSDGVVRDTVGAPLVVHGVLRGALVVGRHGAGVDEHEVRLVELLADHAARALELMQDHAATRVSIDGTAAQADYLGTVAHELRTPLQSVLGYAETVERRWDALSEDDRRQMITRLSRNAQGLRHVVEAMLDNARLEAGAVEPHRRQFTLVPVVREVVERLAGMATEHQVVVEAAGAPDGGSCWGDPLLLERVVENLLSNAIRHTPGRTRVEVVIEVRGDDLAVVVRDDGPGIARADVDRLGRRFYRAGSEGVVQGVGLGLSFVVEVLRLHGASLDVRSTPGDGAAFSFSLARSPAAVDA